MPPKKNKAKSAKEASPKKSYDKIDVAVPTEHEVALRQELDGLDEQIKALKKQLEDLQKDNDWLQEEAQKTRVESHEYMSYMSKKSQKRQSTIVTLSDRNDAELKSVRQQTAHMMSEYERRKDGLRTIMLEKESELAKTERELNDLDEYRVLQEAQESEIRRLEKEVDMMRFRHADEVHKLKSSFLAEKRDLQQSADAKVAELQQKANVQAVRCFREHTKQIRTENKELRRELLSLIQEGRALRDKKVRLEKQHSTLVRERQFIRDLKAIRENREHRAIREVEAQYKN
ncbi:coiled-coil domain-containing protein 166-like [Oscarella lobularis]|uniref:coiled-coil domain-containing protein 166-like n=1 Tax=Oscarella lobularis TaxID=121494 RepID=UPI003313600A